MFAEGFRIRDLADVAAVERIPFTERLEYHDTYSALRAAALERPDKVAIYDLATGSADDEATAYTYGEVIEQITRTANLFHDLGARAGDVISILLPIIAEAEFVLWGAEAAAIANPINPFLEVGQLASLMRAANTRIAVTTGPSAGDGVWQKVEAVRAQVPGIETVVVVREPTAIGNAVSFEAALDKQPGDRLVSGRDFHPGDIAAYFHTGGTTGLPKLAVHTHQAELLQAWTTAAMLGVASDRVVPMGLPFFHIANAIVSSLRGFLTGETLVLLSPQGLRNPTVIRDYWRIVEKFRATMIGGVPTTLAAIMNVPIGDADLSSVRTGFCGGSSAPVALLEQARETLGIEIIEGWGMTETMSYMTLNPRHGEVRFGSVGLPVPYHRVRTIEVDGRGRFERFCAVGEIGLVIASGPGVFPGYVEDRHNAGAFVSGMPDDGRWLNTGDLGRLDKDGYLWLTGRAKDVIIRGGHNIDPVVIEETLSRHPAVLIAAAVGMADRHAGELPVAYVQLRPGATASADELVRFARDHIPERAAAPVWIQILDAMPVTGVGKIFKPALRQKAAKRAFEAALEPLRAEGLDCSVSVAADSTHGTLAMVSVQHVADEARPRLERKIKDALDRFTLPHGISWD